MRLDRTQIVIRERSLAEILDLALQVWRRMFWPLLWSSAVLVVPLAFWNWWLLHPLVDLEQTWFSIWRYGWTMALLVIIEAPLATAGATLVLGRAVFDERVRLSTLLRDMRRWAVPLLVVELGTRGGLLAWWAAWSIDTYADFSPAEGFLILIALGSLGIRAARPYATEVIVLERNPLWRRPRVVSIHRRLQSLRATGSGEATNRILVGGFLGAALLYALWTSFWFVQGTFFSQWQLGPVMIHILLPASMWLIAIFLMVVRFLAYLDLRIRREGWEVELQLRASAAALARPASTGAGR